MSPAEMEAIWQAVWLTFKLASITTLVLLLLCTPLAWWLATTRSWFKGPISAVVALPLVLPPVVIGFYLLVLMGPKGPVGQLTQSLGLGLLPFTFAGLVVGSVFYSLPFVVQPLANAFESLSAPRWRLPPRCVHRRLTRFLASFCLCPSLLTSLPP